MNIFDWSVIALYIVGIIATGAMLGRTQTDINDYFLGGQKVSWWESVKQCAYDKPCWETMNLGAPIGSSFMRSWEFTSW